jgi:hypothetical protein
MQGIAALVPDNSIMMPENGVNLCFDSKVFLCFDMRTLLLVHVFQHCIFVNTTNTVVERRGKYFTDPGWTVGYELNSAISSYRGIMQVDKLRVER